MRAAGGQGSPTLPPVGPPDLLALGAAPGMRVTSSAPCVCAFPPRMAVSASQGRAPPPQACCSASCCSRPGRGCGVGSGPLLPSALGKAPGPSAGHEGRCGRMREVTLCSRSLPASPLLGLRRPRAQQLQPSRVLRGPWAVSGGAREHPDHISKTCSLQGKDRRGPNPTARETCQTLTRTAGAEATCAWAAQGSGP